MSNAYYPGTGGPYQNPPPPAYGQPTFTGPNYGPPPPSYGQPTFQEYGTQPPPPGPNVYINQPNPQPQVVVVEEHRNTGGLTSEECCLCALCAFCCGLCLAR